MIKVLLADPHAVLRHGLRLILQEDPGLKVIGEAATGREAIAQTIALTPDIVLMDLNFPDINGAETILQIRRAGPETQVLILTVSNRSEDMLAACRAGARGYLLKSVGGGDVIQAIYQVAAGQAMLSPPVATCLLDELANPSPPLQELTDRELDVLQYLTQGLGNKEIASTLNISQNTVKTHVRRILGKLNLRNRTEAATYAMQTNLISQH